MLPAAPVTKTLSELPILVKIEKIRGIKFQEKKNGDEEREMVWLYGKRRRR